MSHKRVAIIADDQAPAGIPHVQGFYGKLKRNTLSDEDAKKSKYCATSKGSDLYGIYDNIRKTKGDMILKVQIPLSPLVFLTPLARTNPPAIDLNGKILAYNQDRSFQCFLDMNKLDADDIVGLLLDKGMYRIKGFFSAFMEEGTQELCLIADTFKADLGW